MGGSIGEANRGESSTITLAPPGEEQPKPSGPKAPLGRAGSEPAQSRPQRAVAAARVCLVATRLRVRVSLPRSRGLLSVSASEVLAGVMFRRLARARRRVPVQSAGHDSSDRSEPNAREEEPSPHVYHTCLGTDGPVPLLIEGLARDQRLKRPEILRHHARSLVSHVNQEERNAAQAWSRLRQLYDVFRAIQTAQEKSELGQLEPDDDDDVLASLLANGDANDTVLNDFHELTSQLPEGFSSQMFADLGNALYSEMQQQHQQQQHHQQPRGISRQSLETLGDHLLSQSASVAASPRSSSSSIVSVSVSA